jgi:hypothetical protein
MEEEWTWDEIESEQVEEREQPFQSARLADVSAENLAKQKQSFGTSKHKKHHRHDLHLHLPKHPHNRTGGRPGVGVALAAVHRRPGPSAVMQAWLIDLCRRPYTAKLASRAKGGS